MAGSVTSAVSTPAEQRLGRGAREGDRREGVPGRATGRDMPARARTWVKSSAHPALRQVPPQVVSKLGEVQPPDPVTPARRDGEGRTGGPRRAGAARAYGSPAAPGRGRAAPATPPNRRRRRRRRAARRRSCDAPRPATRPRTAAATGSIACRTGAGSETLRRVAGAGLGRSRGGRSARGCRSCGRTSRPGIPASTRITSRSAKGPAGTPRTSSPTRSSTRYLTECGLQLLGSSPAAPAPAGSPTRPGCPRPGRPSRPRGTAASTGRPSSRSPWSAEPPRVRRHLPGHHAEHDAQPVLNRDHRRGAPTTCSLPVRSPTHGPARNLDAGQCSARARVWASGRSRCRSR